MKVLIVEDNPDSRNLLAKQLRAYGHEVSTAANGVEALRQGLQDIPDIVVSDIQMPQMDGYQLCHEWKQSKQLKDIPFVFYTATYTSSEDEKFALSLGAHAFIRKPAEPEILTQLLCDILEKASSGRLPHIESAPIEPSAYLVGHNQRLVAKLEKKVKELHSEISERKKDEAEILRLNRLYAVISQVNQTVIRATSSQALLDDVCRIIVEKGGFKLAWIGRPERETRRVLPIASAGARDYVTGLVVYTDERPEGRGQVGTSIREKRPFIQNDFMNDPNTRPWHARAAAFGFRGSASFPIKAAGEVWGALAVYSDTIGYFGEKEANLLEESAGDIGFALDNLEREQKRRRAEKALQAEERRLASIYDTVGDVIFLLALEPGGVYRFSSVNPAFGRVTGLPVEAVVGKTVNEVIPEPSLSLVLGKYRQAATEKTIVRWEETTDYPSGRVIGEVSVAPVYDDFGHCTHLVGAVHDVTERKQAEEELKASEEKYRLLVGNVPSGVAIVQEGRLVFANHQVEQLTGYTLPELQAMDAFSLIRAEDRARVRNYNAMRTRGESAPSDYDLAMTRKDGSLCWLSRRVVSIDWQGKPSTLVLDTEVTERVQAEQERQQLRDKAEMSSRLAAVGEMAAGIAHEINNPLTGVIGFSELLMEQENLPADVRDDLRIINNGSLRVKEIIKRMLTFSRQAAPVKTRVNIHELIDSTLEIRGYVLKTANIEIIRNYDPALPWVIADPGQLQQVFLNLIVNAEYAMKKAHERGQLTINTSCADGSVRISFKDDGPGISDEIKPRLFQPFFTTKAKGEGTGLGLSLSRTIVVEHGGTISVESNPGLGAEFIITLPIKPLVEQGSAALPADTIKPLAPIKSARILAIDDEADIGLLIKKTLGPMGYKIDTTDNPGEALTRLDSINYDAILLDIRMPGMSGMEFYAKISQLHPEYLKKLIFMTGDTSGMDVRSFLRQNSFPYIEKPFGQKELLQALVNIVK